MTIMNEATNCHSRHACSVCPIDYATVIPDINMVKMSAKMIMVKKGIVKTIMLKNWE